MHSKSLEPIKGNGPLTVRIAGQITHHLSTVEPRNKEQPTFSQLFFLDEAEAAVVRKANTYYKDLEHDVLSVLDYELRTHHPLAKMYKSLKECEEEEMFLAAAENRDMHHVRLMIHTDKRNDDQRRYNQPTSNDVACVFKSVDGAPPGNRKYVAKLIVPSGNESWKTITYLNPMCDEMAYTIFYPSGGTGWSSDMRQVQPLEPMPQLTDEQQEEEDNRIHLQSHPNFNVLPNNTNEQEENFGFGLEDDHGNNTKCFNHIPFTCFISILCCQFFQEKKLRMLRVKLRKRFKLVILFIFC